MKPGTSPSWIDVEPYLDQVLELEEHAREHWLTGLAVTQPGIVARLRDLLQQRAALDSAGFMSRSLLATDEGLVKAAFDALAQSSPAEGDSLLSPAASAPPCAPDQEIGPYKLIREIGRGGMSTVWLARRGDEQLKRDIALKLPSLGHRLHVEHFQRERDLLATLTHPNIARLYDAGITAAGQPYLAMEYIAGIAVTEACDKQTATVRERLQLFLQVLEVVEFAHAQLVIHRDLKPPNILVTPESRVVLLDFGVGKLLGEQLQGQHLTEMYGHAFTPNFASPEQIARQPLGTPSDIYSLGVILYELLTGKNPYRTKRDSRAALEEAVLAGDLRPPSQSEPSAHAASARKTSVRALLRSLTGDLDTIVLKALRREPTARYASATAFAQDIRDHLNRLPISARPDRFWYRSARFISRHRVPVTAAALIAVAMAGGTGVALWQATKAAAERDRAAALATRSDATTNFLSTLITEAAASSTPVSVTDMLARAEKLAVGDPGATNESRATVLALIASYRTSLGDVKAGEEFYQKASALLINSRDIDLRARIACSLAAVVSQMGRHAEAIRELDARIADPRISPMTATECLMSHAAASKRGGDNAGALRYAQLALERLHEAGNARTIDEAIVLTRVAGGMQFNGRNAEAREYFRQALQKYRASGSAGDIPSIVVKSDLAGLESASGNPRGALKLFEEAAQGMRERDASGREPAVLAQNRGRMLQLVGRYDEARAVLASALETIEGGGSRMVHTLILLKLASVAEDVSDRASAVRYLDLANQSFDASSPAASPVSTARMLVEAKLEMMDRHFDRAKDRFAQTLSVTKRDPVAVEAALGRAEAALLGGDAKSADADARFALDVATSLQAGVQFSNRTGLSWLMAGRVAQQFGDVAQARKAFLSAVEHLSNTVDADHPALLQARQLLAQIAH